MLTHRDRFGNVVGETRTQEEELERARALDEAGELLFLKGIPALVFAALLAGLGDLCGHLLHAQHPNRFAVAGLFVGGMLCLVFRRVAAVVFNAIVFLWTAVLSLGVAIVGLLVALLILDVIVRVVLWVFK